MIRSFCDGIRKFTKFDMSVMYRKPRQIMNHLRLLRPRLEDDALPNAGHAMGDAFGW